MRRFRFALEKVLKLRVQETDLARRALGQALLLEGAAREALTAAATVRDARTAAAVAREQGGGLAVFEFATLRSHLAFLQKDVEAAESHVAAAEAVTRQRRVALLEARRREKALEKLREHRLEQYQVESLREEQKEFDEYGNRPGLNRASGEPDI